MASTGRNPPEQGFNRVLNCRGSRAPMTESVDIAPAKGKLGMLLPGPGAVPTTLIAGVLASR